MMATSDVFGCSRCGGNTVPDGARCPWCWRGFPDSPAPFVDVDRETAYGTTVRLSFVVRVF